MFRSRMSVISMQSLATHVCPHRIELAIRTLYANAAGPVQTTAALVTGYRTRSHRDRDNRNMAAGTFLNSGLRKFRHGISIVETCYLLSSRRVDAQSVINWAVVGQLS